MSSVTVACTVRSQSARLESSSSSLKIACWLRSLSRRCASTARRCRSVVRRSSFRRSHSSASAASVPRANTPGSQAPERIEEEPNAPRNASASAPASARSAATPVRTSSRSTVRAGAESFMNGPLWIAAARAACRLVSAGAWGKRESRGSLGESGALENGTQRQDRPVLISAPERTREVTLAARHRRRRIPRELALREAPEAEHLINEQPRRDLAVVDDDDARVAGRRRHAAAEELPQVDDRQQLPADVRETSNPGLRPWHARERGRHGEHFARLLARGEEELARHAQRNPHPLAAAGRFLARVRGNGAPAPLQLLQQLERPVAQRFERDPLHRF